MMLQRNLDMETKCSKYDNDDVELVYNKFTDRHPEFSHGIRYHEFNIADGSFKLIFKDGHIAWYYPIEIEPYQPKKGKK